MNKINKSKKYMIIGIILLVLSLIGSTYAYYSATASSNAVSGTAGSVNLTLNVTKKSTAATGSLIPVDNDTTTLTKAVKGYGFSGEEYDAAKSCIDKNGYTACQVYEIIVTNTGTVPLQVDGGVTLSGSNTSNIDCAVMNSLISVTDNKSCKGTKTLAKNLTINAGLSYTTYVVVYINNVNSVQTDSGNFNGTITFKTAGGKVKAKFTDEVNVAEYITSLYNDATKTEVTAADSITYNYATSEGLMNDRLGSTSTGINNGNIRYYGEDPNNYINIGDVYESDTVFSFEENGYWSGFGISTEAECLAFPTNMCSNGGYEDMDFSSESDCEANIYKVFNEYYGMSLASWDEFCTGTIIPEGTPKLYRIIGIFKNVELEDGTTADLVKVIRNNSIGIYSWDYSESSVNNGNGVNEWSQADLMKLLNPGYSSEPVGGSLWYNSGSGNCYGYDFDNYSLGSVSCDFTNAGLSSSARNKIASVKWYLGGYGSALGYASNVFNIERGTTVVTNPTDGITRTTTWVGRVALMYPSDFGYAADLSLCTKAISSYDDRESNDEFLCYKKNWLNLISNNTTYGTFWFLTPYTANSYYVFWRNSQGGIYYSGKASSVMDVLPTFYLNANVALTGDHTGTKDDPYVVAG